MNPARSFGPALCAAAWAHHWVGLRPRPRPRPPRPCSAGSNACASVQVYWVGPLSGSLLATLGYVALWRPLPPPAAPSPAPSPAPSLAPSLAPRKARGDCELPSN